MDEQKSKLTRRDFLKASGSGAALAVLAACAPVPAAPAQPAQPAQPQATAAPAKATTAPSVPTVLKSAKTDLNFGIVRWDPGDVYFNGVQLGQELERQRLEKAEGVKIAFTVFGKNDAAAQLTALQAQIAKGVDAVMLVPWKGEAFVPILTEMRSKGMPCVTHNAIVPQAPQVHVAHDNQLAAKKAGLAALDWLNKNEGENWWQKDGVIIEMRCIITASFDTGRHAGYHEVFDPFTQKNPNLKWEVRECQCDGSCARKAVDDIISRYGKDKIVAVCSIDGEMGIGGAISAFKAQGMQFPATDKRFIPVVTVDSSDVEMEAIGRGEQLAAAEQPAVGEGIMAMRLAYQMVKTGKIITKPAAKSVMYDKGDEQGAKEPWMPIQVIPDDRFDGPWYQTTPFVTPFDLPLNDHGHWASIMYYQDHKQWPDWTKVSG